MNLPGMRYRILATRCRQSASSTTSVDERAALLQMAKGYDRRADEIESDWKDRAQVGNKTAQDQKRTHMENSA